MSGNGQDPGQGRRRKIHLAATLTALVEEPVLTGGEVAFYTYLRCHVSDPGLMDQVLVAMIKNIEDQRQKIAQAQVAALMAATTKPGGPR